ncbi:MAG: Eco57I restriction-modification methylase domain-containing protein, partial [Myxococcota bacterium]
MLDPCVGDGRFLVAVRDHLVSWAARRGRMETARSEESPGERDRLVRAVTAHCLIGLERDSEFAELARRRLGPEVRIHRCEALLDAPTAASGVDAVVGNPPYVRSIRFARSDPELWRALRGRYAATSHGEWDLYAAFIEQAVDWLGPGGEAGLVVPSRWLTAAFAGKLRGKLARAAAVRAVVDFGAAQLFAAATTYTSLVFLSRARADQVAVARLSGPNGRRWSFGRVPTTSLSDRPWRLVVGEDRSLIHALGESCPTLGQVARVAKGAGTNADSVFVIEDATQTGPDGELIRGRSRVSGPDQEVVIEAAACRPCVRGRDVVAYGRVDPIVQCIVPYDRAGQLWSPATLARYPHTRAYVERWRERLEGRERGRYRDARFYRFGRPQNMALLGAARAKIVVPDVAQQGRAMIDRDGAMILDSAYVI